MTRYKYYFRKPKSEIAKDIFSWLLVGGIVCVAATSPFFLTNISKAFKKSQKYKKKKIYDAFYQLRKQGCIRITEKDNQIYIGLTERGRKKAGWLQIDSLKIKRPKKWDGKWRMVIFDIAQLKKIYREAFRGKLKELGFCPLQKSVWVYPFDCCGEIGLLQKFFGLSEKEMRFIIAQNIGEDEQFKKIFKLS